MKRPFVWFLISLIAGTVAGRYIQSTFLNMFLFFIAAAAISAVFSVRLKILEPMYMPFIFIIGMMLCTAALSPKIENAQRMLDQEVQIYGTVRNRYVTDSGKNAVTIDVSKISDGMEQCTDKLKIIAYTQNRAIAPGDIIISQGRLYSFDEPTNPYQANYKIYMLSMGYDYSAWCKSIRCMGEKDGIIYSIEKAREQVNTFFESNMPEREAGIAKALTTGYKNDLSEKTRENFERLGISHILAVSGLHISIITYLMLFLCTEVFKIQKRKAIPFASLTLVFYLIFTGFSPSAFRAVMMSVVSFSGLILYRNSDRINTAAFSAFVLLWINPLYLWNVSFQLSYIGIAAVYASLEILGERERKNRWGKIEKSILISAVSWTIVSPVVMYYFKGVSLLAVIANLIFVPVISAVTCLAMITGLLSFFALGSAQIGAKVVYFVLNIYNNITQKLSENILAYMNVSQPPFTAIIGIYGFIFAVLLLKQTRKMKIAVTMAFAVFMAVLAVDYVQSPAEIVFFDAGQGDASAIYIPRRLTAVIDGGPDGGAENSVIPYLEAKGEKIDLLFVTHMDADHVTGAIRLMNNDLVMRAVISDTVHKNEENLNRFLYAAKMNDIPVIYAGKGDRLDIGEHCYFECLYPDTENPDSENNASLVMKFCYEDTSFLFTGDIDANAEGEILNQNIQCDVIKIAHHGSKTSSSEEFIKKTGAQTAVIQASEDNIYGFPDRQVVDLLEKLDMDVYVTGSDGAVVMYDNGNSIKIKTYGS